MTDESEEALRANFDRAASGGQTNAEIVAEQRTAPVVVDPAPETVEDDSNEEPAVTEPERETDAAPES